MNFLYSGSCVQLGNDLGRIVTSIGQEKVYIGSYIIYFISDMIFRET